MKRRIKTQTENNNSSWMVTFSDAVTLMITFFVLIIAMSSMDTKSLKQSFSFFSGSPGNLGEGKEGSLKFQILKRQFKINYEEFKQLLIMMGKYRLTEREGIKLLKLEKLLGKNYKYKVESEDVIAKADSSIFFEEYGYNLNSSGMEQLKKLVKILNNYNDKVYIDVYTSSFPISTPTVKNNVDLSIKRVSKIVEYLKNANINLQRIFFSGWGDVKVRKDCIKIVFKNYLKLNNQEVTNG